MKIIWAAVGVNERYLGCGRRWGCVFTTCPLTIYPPFRTTFKSDGMVPIINRTVS